MSATLRNAALLILLGASLALAQTSQPATAPATSTAPATIPWNQAKDHLNQTASVTGPVIATHTASNGKSVTLNVGKDFPDKDRFSVFLPAVENPDDLYKGKTITVTGKITTYRDIPQIKAEPKDITIQK